MILNLIDLIAVLLASWMMDLFICLKKSRALKAAVILVFLILLGVVFSYAFGSKL